MAEDVDEVSADVELLGGFVDAGERYVGLLSELEVELAGARRLTAGVLGGGPTADGLASVGALEELLAAADRTNRFVGEVREVLLSAPVSGRPRPKWGRVLPDIGPTVHVAAAVEIDRGLWDAGLLNIGDAGLSEDRRDALAADVLAGVPADSAAAGLILSRAIPPVTDVLRYRVAAAVENGRSPGEAGIDPRYFPPGYRPSGQAPELQSPFNRLSAIEATGTHLGKHWQGRALAAWYLAADPIDPLGAAGAPLSTVAAMADQVAGSVDTAVGFFNTAGPSGTARLVKIQPGDPAWGYLDPGNISRFSTALADASRTGSLGFTGGDLIGAQLDGGYLQPGVPLLFTTGDFDADFLVGATLAQLRNHIDLDALRGGEVYGPSGTNILLARAAESADVSGAVIKALHATENGGGADQAHHYLQPARAFQPAADGSYPITLFLAAAGTDPQAAAIILTAAADQDGGFSDPGVAGGVDVVMARHATIMYPAGYLQDLGISTRGRLTRRDWTGGGHTGRDWKRLRDLVLEHGQGAGLAAGNKQLVLEAMDTDLSADGDLSSDRHHYELVALNAGALDEQWFQRVIEIRKQQDLSNTRRNNYVSAGLSVGVALGSTILLPATPVGAAVGFGIGAGTSGGLARFPIDIWDTDLTITELQDRLATERRSNDLWRDAVVASLVRRAQQAGTPVTDPDGNILTIEQRNGTPQLIATHPTTGQRTINPTIHWHPDGPIGDPRNDTTSQIDEHYEAGQAFMDPGGEPDDPEQIRTDIGAWMVIPAFRKKIS